MNAATRGVILAIAAVALGVIILGQGFDDPGSVTVDASSPEATATPDPGTDGGETDPGEGTDGGETDGGETDGGDGGETDGGEGTEGGDGEDGTDPGDGGDGTDTGDGGDGTDTGDGSDSVLHDASEVRVLVVNGTTVSGAAGTVNNELLAEGYIGLTPTNTDPIGAATASVVHYQDGYELDAAALAKRLNIPASQVSPIPDDIPVTDLQEANVVIILGPDIVPGA